MRILDLSWFAASRITNLFECAFDELFTLIAKAVINGGHGLDDTGSGTSERKLAVFHFALIEGEGSVTKHHESAVGEFTGVVFMEVQDDFFIGELVIADFHRDSSMGGFYGIGLSFENERRIIQCGLVRSCNPIARKTG